MPTAPHLEVAELRLELASVWLAPLFTCVFFIANLCRIMGTL